MKKNILKLLFSLSVLLLLPISVFAIDTSLPTIKNPFDSLQVKIPGMQRFTEPTFSKDGTTTNISVNWIGEYIMGIYKYGISIIGILAVLAMAIGGVIWILSFGNPSTVAVGKEWITGAILGVVLALGSYILLNTINADLVRMRPIQVAYIKNYDDPGDEASVNTVDNNNFPTSTDPCPPDGSTFDQVVNYYLTQRKLNYSQALRGTQNYSDCSHFAGQLAKCSGFKAVPGEGRTRALFIEASNNRQKLSQNTDLESILTPGDIVGYNDGKVGHVLTYVGKGQLIECGGTVSKNIIIQENGCVKLTNYKDRLKGYFGRETLYYIKR